MHFKYAVIASVWVVVVSSGQAQMWSLAGDWSPPANPNGAWTYGEYVGTSFVDLSWATGFNADIVGGYVHNGDESSGGFLYQNTAVSAIYGIDPGQVALESDWGTAVARWTAPTAGEYRISLAIGGTTFPEGPGFGNEFAQYAGMNIDGSGVSAASFVNNVMSWTTLRHLAGGSTVDAYVSNPGFALGGSTQTLFTVTAVPEPSTMAVVGMGLAALVKGRKRRFCLPLER